MPYRDEPDALPATFGPDGPSPRPEDPASRLRWVDGLHDQELIDAEEHARLRAQVLADL